MLLVDTSVWIDHLHAAEPVLVDALHAAAVHQHPMVLGELALGTLADRSGFLRLLGHLPSARVASPAEVLHLVAHLLAATLLTPGLRLWTRDRALRAAAEELDVPFLAEV